MSVAVGATTRTLTVTPPRGATVVSLQVVGDPVKWLTPPPAVAVGSDGKATFTLTLTGQSWAACTFMLWAYSDGPNGGVFARIPVGVKN